jgi:hypothetical protein
VIAVTDPQGFVAMISVMNEVCIVVGKRDDERWNLTAACHLARPQGDNIPVLERACRLEAPETNWFQVDLNITYPGARSMVPEPTFGAPIGNSK